MKYQIAKKKYLKYTHWVFANYPHKLEESQDWICCHRYTLWRHSHYCTGWHCIVVLLLHRTVMYHLKHATHAIVHFETIQQIHQSISPSVPILYCESMLEIHVKKIVILYLSLKSLNDIKRRRFRLKHLENTRSRLQFNKKAYPVNRKGLPSGPTS